MISKRHTRELERTVADANEHVSGGTYDMTATYVKGCRFLQGLNKLRCPAPFGGYAEMQRRHAEAHLVAQILSNGSQPKGGTIYVAGTRNGNRMQNTEPCKRCRQLLRATFRGSTKICFYRDGQPTLEAL